MSDKEYEQLLISTHEAMMNPRIGDRFEEFYCFWMYVVKVTPKFVWSMSASAPCEFPKDGVLKRRTKKAFQEYYSYKSDDPRMKNKYWVHLCDRDNDVEGWI